MRRKFLHLFLALLLVPGSAFADCTSPTALNGSFGYFGTPDFKYKLCAGSAWVDFNTPTTLTACTQEGSLDYDVTEAAFKYCDSANWKKVPCKTGADAVDCPNIGDVCDSGAINAGITPDGDVAMMVTSSNVSKSWGAGSGNIDTGLANCTVGTEPECRTGASNTAFLATADCASTAGVQDCVAAKYCSDLVSNGYSDWYLPAKDEVEVLYTNRVAIGLGSSPWLWSSSEIDASNAHNKFFGGSWVSRPKTLSEETRCVRKNTGSSSTPSGAVGTTVTTNGAAERWYRYSGGDACSTGTNRLICMVDADASYGYFKAPGTFSYVVPAGVTSVTLQAWGAGGAGGGFSKPSGGGGGSVVLRSSTMLVAGGGGGGGSEGKGAGGGGYATSVVAVTPGETLTVYVGGGGNVATLTVSGAGGDYAGGAGGGVQIASPGAPGGSSTYGGGGGGGHSNGAVGGVGGTSVYGGGGGGGHANGSTGGAGGASTYGGGGGGSPNSTNGAGGASTNGLAGIAGGAGGGGGGSGTTITNGSSGSNATGGNAANSGPGKGGNSGVAGGPGRVVITPSGYTLYPGGSYFVLTSTSYGANLGGLSGANATCLSHLQANNWMGKSNVETLNSSNVKAFLCDGSTCQSPVLNPSLEPYYFAVAGSVGTGGASFLPDGSGIGPGNSTAWTGATYFGVTATFWTGRSAGGSTTDWGTVPASITCSGWTSTSASYGCINKGACSVAGQINYDNTTKSLRWCDGNFWRVLAQ